MDYSPLMLAHCITGHPVEGSVSDTRKSAKVVDVPSVIDGGVSRSVETPDGGASIETWDPNSRSWVKGGATFGELMAAPPASDERMDALGIPESERG